MRGGALQIRIERGVDAVRLIVQFVLAKLVDQRVAHHVDEVWSVAGFDVQRRKLQRCGLGFFGVGAGNGVRLSHGVEHSVAALERPLGMAIWRQGTGRLDQAGKQGSFGQRDVFQVLVEVRPRGFREAADGERSALAEVDAIAVELEDLLLAEFLLEFERDHDFRQLALDGLFRRQEERSRQLHGDGRSALLVALAGNVDPEGLREAQEVDAAMLEETAVFDGENRVDHHLGNFVVFHDLALGALLGVEQGGNQLRLKFVGGEIAAAAADADDLSVTHQNASRIGAVIRLRAGRDLDAVVQQAVGAHLRLVALLPISGMAQLGRDRLGRNGLAGTDDFRRGVDVGGVAEDGTAEAFDDDAVVFDVEIRKHADHQDRQSEKDDQDGADDWVSG